MTDYISKRAVVNGVNLHYIVAGEGPVVLKKLRIAMLAD
jgi:hypothetical protein